MTVRVRTRADILLAAVISLTALALALKILRYSGERPDDPAAAMARVGRLLAAHGWAEQSSETFLEGMPLVAAVFAKSGCPATTVTILGRKSELMRYVSDLHGGDLVFVRADRPLARLGDRIRGDAGKVKPLPLMAVAPAPHDPTCSLPLER